MKCIRCGSKALTEWDVCADGNKGRPLCIECDIKLNEIVLCWMGFRNWKSKMVKYRAVMRMKEKANGQ